MGTSNMSRSRGGYTAIEMAVVLGIVMILATMATMAIVPALRKGRVNDATNAIVQISRQARLLAMQRSPPADNKHYGVIIGKDPTSNSDMVALIYGAGTPADMTTTIAKDVNSKPIAQHIFAPSVSTWNGNSELRGQTPAIIAWYYEYLSGLPIGPAGASFTTTPVLVGATMAPKTAVWGIAGNDFTVGAVAPGASVASGAYVPGLSIRTLDNRIRRAIAIYVSGLPVTAEF
jgi:type II secretory pathway pseudopilin PulG